MKTATLNWRVKTFEQLNTSELYEILKLRAEVFVVEQNCAYQDLDGLDEQSIHILGWTNNGTLAAYARILPEELCAELPSERTPIRHGRLGRIVVAPSCRGIGHQLLNKAIEIFNDKVGDDVPCIIHAQAHLQKFYEAHGFEKSGEPFLLDNIKHIEMIRRFPRNLNYR